MTESDLHRLVKESVKSILKESGKGLGYGLLDAEKKALRTKMGGFKLGTETYQDMVAALLGRRLQVKYQLIA